MPWQPPPVPAVSLARKVEERPRRPISDAAFRARVRALRLPMVPGVTVHDPLPGQIGAAVADPGSRRIHTEGGLDRFTAAHESFHMLDTVLTDRDKRRLARKGGLGARPWDIGSSGAVQRESQGYRQSASEVLADFAAMLQTRHDPKSNRVVGAYLDTKDVPSRRRLLRFGRELDRIGQRLALPEYVRPRRG